MKFKLNDIVYVDAINKGIILESHHNLNTNRISYKIRYKDGSVEMEHWIDHKLLIRFNRALVRDNKLNDILT